MPPSRLVDLLCSRLFKSTLAERRSEYEHGSLPTSPDLLIGFARCTRIVTKSDMRWCAWAPPTLRKHIFSTQTHAVTLAVHVRAHYHTLSHYRSSTMLSHTSHHRLTLVAIVSSRLTHPAPLPHSLDSALRRFQTRVVDPMSPLRIASSLVQTLLSYLDVIRSFLF